MTDDQIDALTAQTIRLIRSADSVRHRLATLDQLGPTEVRAVSRIGQAGQVTPKMLATALEMTTGAVTAILDRLETAGLLRRLPNPADRRSTLIELTAEGKTVSDRMYVEFNQVVASVTKFLDGDNIGTVTEFLEQAADAMYTHASTDRDGNPLS
ncbi:MarR family winged helix-turn-helix transcriptional regulator [Naasia lichenicola]|uniref:MarR family winged helix-turn-helix transcriptional regulator n=1 Tax=Naasia lichenicola TaxID=2565933 RepID=UPI00130DEF03|nr:MarR family transcriptional regulator [Naasia lichenicola]